MDELDTPALVSSQSNKPKELFLLQIAFTGAEGVSWGKPVSGFTMKIWKGILSKVESNFTLSSLNSEQHTVERDSSHLGWAGRIKSKL